MMIKNRSLLHLLVKQERNAPPVKIFGIPHCSDQILYISTGENIFLMIQAEDAFKKDKQNLATFRL